MINGNVERFSKQRRRYSAGIADPPWPEKGGGKIKRGADRHYETMTIKQICELQVYGRHVSELFAANAHLYMWVTNNFLEKSFEVVKAWGFKYVTCVTWGKVKVHYMPSGGELSTIQTGLGQYFRGSTEHLLFLKRGSLPYKITNGKRAQGRTLYLAPRTETHSEKPGLFHEVVEKVSYGPYIELFARERRAGWSAWGNEVNRKVA